MVVVNIRFKLIFKWKRLNEKREKEKKKTIILIIVDAASIDVASHRGGNPSIGEASLSLGSGSHLEKLGRENDRESASNVAVAGTSLAGSIASSVLPGGQR